MRVLLLSLCLLALAGCSASPGPASAGSESTPPTAAFAGPPEASPMPAPADPSADPSVPANATAPFRMEGETPVGACLFAPAVAHCELHGGRDSFRELEAPGLPLRVSGTLRWNATLAGGDPVPLQVSVMHDEGGGWTFGAGDPFASGPSPLEFDLPLLTLRGRLALSVTQSAGAPLVVGYAVAMAPHAFVLDGEVAYQAAEDGGARPV